jgi:PAS domain S-box-containing protein
MNNDEERKDLIEEVSRLEAKVLELERLHHSSHERAEFLQEILDSIPPMISAWGRDGIMKYVNQSFVNASGFGREAFIGISLNDLYPPQEIDRVSKVYEELELEPDGASRIFRGHGITADGKWVFVDGITIKKTLPPIGGFVGYGVNVTDHVSVETDYKESVEAMGTLFNSVQDGLLIHDKTGSFVQLNQKVSEIFGTTLSDITLSVPQLKAEKFYCPDDDSFDLHSVWNDVLAGETKQLEYRIKRQKDGKLFDVDVFMCPIQLRGHGHILVSIKDITEKKRVADELHRTMILAEKLRKRAEAASEAKSKFLANMSHELRTPLNAILGFSELLEGQFYGAINEKQSAYLKAIRGSGAHLLHLINDVLDIAKIEARKMEMTPSATDLRQLLENAFTMIKEMAYKAGVKLPNFTPNTFWPMM